MSDLFWLTEAQMRRIEPYFPLSHGVPRLADKGYDADWFRAAMADRKIGACIPSKTNRTPHPARHNALPSAAQDRKQVRKAQGLETHTHQI